MSVSLTAPVSPARDGVSSRFSDPTGNTSCACLVWKRGKRGAKSLLKTLPHSCRRWSSSDCWLSECVQQYHLKSYEDFHTNSSENGATICNKQLLSTCSPYKHEWCQYAHIWVPRTVILYTHLSHTGKHLSDSLDHIRQMALCGSSVLCGGLESVLGWDKMKNHNGKKNKSWAAEKSVTGF